MNKDNNLFVYGTLKRGFGNSYILRNSEFIGSAVSEEKFVIYDCGFPCAYPDYNGKRLSGEIYNLTDEDFIFTDRLESNGSLYNREVQDFIFRGELVSAWIYVIINPYGTVYDCNSEVINWNYKAL